MEIEPHNAKYLNIKGEKKLPRPIEGTRQLGQWDGREGKEVRRLFLAFFRVEFHSGAGGGDHQHAVVGPEYLVVDVDANNGIGFHQFGAFSQLAHGG